MLQKILSFVLLAGIASVMVVQAQSFEYPQITPQNTQTLTQFAALQLERGSLDSVAFGIDAASEHGVLASAGQNGVVRLVDVTTGEITMELRGHVDRVTRVQFNPEGTRL
ncbi:MAG: hypothetical protein AAGK74_13020, partial [Chloroflexota bacterium]